MTNKLNVYDLNLKKVAILQNAVNITETKELNKVYSLSFDLPDIDQKNEFCNPYWFVRFGETGDYYRFTANNHKNSETGMKSYECEHTIATLIDDLMWGTENPTGLGTSDVINELLNKQTIKRWRLGTCSLSATYEYLWSQENLLNALYSIPKPWTTPYIWDFDFSTYPWIISLKSIDVESVPSYYIRAKKNLLSSSDQKSHLDICTRLYALGYGEGVNQLTIKEVNNNIPYIQSPASIVSQYGIISRVFVDRSIESAETLLERAKATLKELQEPALTRSFDVADLYPLTGEDVDNAEVGKVVKLVEDGTITYVTKTQRVLDISGNLQVDLSTKATDVANSIADLANRQRIEATYSQGATQFYAWNFAGNASNSKGLVGYAYFPNDLKHLNGVKMKVKLDRFRYYVSDTESGGSSTQTSSSGGGGASTSEAGGGGKATVTGGASSKTTTDGKVTNIYAVGCPETVGASWEGGIASADYDPQYTKTITIDSKQGPTTTALGSTETGDTYLSTDNGGPTTTTLNSTSTGEASSAPVGNNVMDSTYSGTATDGHKHTYVKADAHTHTVFNHAHDISTHGHTIGNHKHTVAYHAHDIVSHGHTFTFQTLGHAHKVIMPWHNHTIVNTSHNHGMDHTHNISVSTTAHTHSVNISPHTHNVDIPSHSHSITNDVYENSTSPTTADIYVDDVKRTTVEDDAELDITSYLLHEGKVPRDQWVKIEVRPAGLAYCQMFGTTIAFIQSYSGGNY